MGSGLTLFTLLFFGLSATIVFLAVYISNGGFWQPTTVPRLEPEWWGPGKAPAQEDKTIRPYKIAVPEKVILDLNQRLDNTRMPTTSLEGINFQYGFNSNTLSKILQFWRKEYKWREREVYLNQYPQFRTNIQGLDVHFLHIKPSKAVKTVPLLLLHGWPGSVREFYSLIKLLTRKERSDEDGFALEIIVPSLPGYGWSSAAVRPGFGTAQMAVVFKGLMERLGHNSWYVQGGDWGSVIGDAMSILFPNSVRGFHSNFCQVVSPVSMIKSFIGSIWPGLIVDEKHQHKMYPLKKVFAKLMEETGYMHIQATKPDTVAVGLNDSPAGLAAYIIEKFSTWTNPSWKSQLDGGLTNKYTYTDLLDNVMIYWVTGSITTSVRLYAEAFSRSNRALKLELHQIKVPVACARFPHELVYHSHSMLKDRYVNLVQSTDFEDGGHFAAMEMSQVLANDVIKFITKIEATRT